MGSGVGSTEVEPGFARKGGAGKTQRGVFLDFCYFGTRIFMVLSGLGGLRCRCCGIGMEVPAVWARGPCVCELSSGKEDVVLDE